MSEQARRMAHLREISNPPCEYASCGRPATKALYNGVNALIGRYCSRHAERALREFKERA